MAYEMVMPYHLHMPSYFLETFTEYPYRKIKALTNYSPNELVRIARLKKAASLLASSEKTISEITYEVGFTSPSYFTKCYKEYFGESPTDFLKRRG